MILWTGSQMSAPDENDTVDMDTPAVVASECAAPSADVAHVDVAGLTDRGHRRPNNEDHFLIARFGRFLETLDTNLPRPDARFCEGETGYALLVADGMGGHAGGEIASGLAISTLLDLVLATPDWILRLDEDTLMQEVLRRTKERLAQINAALMDQARADPDLKGLGTTLTLAWNLRRNLIVAHVGDSRAYLCRRNQLHLLTHDHTFAQSLADQGLIAQPDVVLHRLRHVLTRVLGDAAAAADPDLHTLLLEDGDRLLLCTDGLTEMVDEDLILATLVGAENSEAVCRRLVEQALRAGGKDNVTVAVAGYRFS